MECAFCAIVRGELAKTLVDEGEHCLVILDRNQAARGHLLVIPKRHVALWHDLDLSVVTEMTAKAHRWATVLVEAVNPDGYRRAHSSSWSTKSRGLRAARPPSRGPAFARAP